MAVPYTKKHLPLRDQLELLKSRGLDCGNTGTALQALHDLGYYRLSAYLYPYRVLLGPGEPKETAWQYRADEFIDGASLTDAIQLATFDTKLRSVLFQGLADLEVMLRFQIVYTAGARDTYFHIRQEHLDKKSCNRLPPARLRHKYATAFEHWTDVYDKLIERAGSEDYIQHFNAKYSSEVPIWIAIETFDLGGLTRLFSLLHKDDKNMIAKRFGVSDGGLFHGWLQGLNVLRNHCAHHNRLWNRRISSGLKAIPSPTVDDSLHHLSSVLDRNKLYPWAAVLAYSLKAYDPSSNWARQFRTVLRKFPGVLMVSPASDMAFPAQWDSLPLWNDEPGSPKLTTPVD